MNKPDYTFGDLVRVNGYSTRIFQVDGIRVEQWLYPGEEWTDVIFELYDVGNNDWIEAIGEDLTLVADAGQADEYLAANPAPVEPSSTSFINYAELYGMEGAVNMAKQGGEPRKPTARELSAIEADRRKKERKERAEKIDRLLDEYNDYMRLAAEFGDEQYKARVEYLSIKLAELNDGV